MLVDILHYYIYHLITFDPDRQKKLHSLVISLGWDGIQCLQRFTFIGFNGLMPRFFSVSKKEKNYSEPNTLAER